MCKAVKTISHHLKLALELAWTHLYGEISKPKRITADYVVIMLLVCLNIQSFDKNSHSDFLEENLVISMVIWKKTWRYFFKF